MKENGPIITLDKSEYREIPASEQARGPEAKPYIKSEEKLTIKPEVKRPEIKPSRELNAEQIRQLRLKFTRRQLSELPILALVVPVHEAPEKPFDLRPSNRFLDFIFGIFDFIGSFLHDDEADQEQKAY
jgi:hypothetical protein